MTDREIEDERHPSFAMARFNRVSQSPPGASMFDSEIRHQHYVIFEVMHAVWRRELHRDWLFPEPRTILSLRMSEAQFGALVSSFGSSGVAVTLDRVDGVNIEDPPYEPRMARALNEVGGATETMLAGVAEAVAGLRSAFDSKAGRREIADLLRTLEARVENAPSNARFAAKAFAEHVEEVVTKARYDIEAQVQMAASHGLNAGPDVAGVLDAVKADE